MVMYACIIKDAILVIDHFIIQWSVCTKWRLLNYCWKHAFCYCCRFSFFNTLLICFCSNYVFSIYQRFNDSLIIVVVYKCYDIFFIDVFLMMEKKNIIESKARVLWNFSLSLSYYILRKKFLFFILLIKNDY